MYLKELIKKGESQALEFKVNAENIGRDICAFANTNNGTILVGVDDKRTIVGVKNIKKTEEEIANITHSCDPPIRVTINKTDNILVVKVRYCQRKREGQIIMLHKKMMARLWHDYGTITILNQIYVRFASDEMF